MTDATGAQPQEPIWPQASPLPEGVEVQQVRRPLPISDSDIQNRFGFHKATIEGPESSTALHAQLRREFMSFATLLNNNLERSREASLAFTALEEASMWAHKAIAAGDPLIKEA